MKSAVPTAHMRHAMIMPTGMMTFGLAAAVELPDIPLPVERVSCDPQYHRATT